MGKNKQYLKVSRVAKIIDCSDDFVRELVRNGHLKAISTGPRALRISVVSLKRWLASRKVDPVSFFE